MRTFLVLDVEATGLSKPIAAPLEEHPHIIEIGAIKLDAGFNELDRYQTFVRSPVPIPAEVIKITGITDAMVADAPTFAEQLPALVQFVLGCSAMVAHNLAYDRDMLRAELHRLGRTLMFPWPPEQLCTVEQTQHLTGRYLSLEKLHQWLFNADPGQTHRALEDVELLVKIMRELRQRKML